MSTQHSADAPPRLRLEGVAKSFGPTAALSGVTLEASPGEVHAIIGENGAGKSTLMKILGGVIRPDAGSLHLDGAPYRPEGPREARAAGIVMVHQELSLCPHLTVTENVLLGDEPTRGGFLSWRHMRAEVAATLRTIVAEGRIDPMARVADLSPADQQLVEIARALRVEGCRVVILDEPTSSLGSDDVQRLFGIIQTLRTRGLTILYISHFLEEISQIADSFTVLRDGRTVGRGRVEGTAMNDVVSMMAGRTISELFPRTSRVPGEVVLTVAGLAGEKTPRDASLELKKGEVLGIAGLIGAGRTELLRLVFGLDRVKRGEVTVAAFSREVGRASPSRRLAQGIGLLSEDRKGEGLALSLSIADNLTLSRLPAFASPTALRKLASPWIDRLAIRCRDASQSTMDLSGGNQQKVAIARLLHHDVDVFLLDEPTRGIDVGSKEQIYRLIDDLASRGKSVIMVSSYLPELLGVCDRIAVMSRGRLGAARAADACTPQSILTEATGG